MDNKQDFIPEENLQTDESSQMMENVQVSADYDECEAFTANDEFAASEETAESTENAETEPEEVKQDVNGEQMKTEEKKPQASKTPVKKNVVSRKKGMKITGKMLSLVAAIIAVLLVAVVISVSINVRSNSEDFMEEWLKSTSYAVSSYYDAMSAGDYLYSNGELRKGSMVISGNNEFIDAMKKDLGVYTAIFYGKQACVSSYMDKDGNRDMSMTVDQKTINAMAKKEGYFTSGYTVSGTDYYAYFTPLLSNDGQVIGILYCGVEEETVESKIVSTIGFIILVVVIVAATSLLSAYVLLRKIVNSIKKSVNNVNKLAEGQLNFKVPKSLRRMSDESGDMARSVQKVVTNMREIIEKIIGATDSLASFTDEFTKSFENITGTIDNVNIAVDEIANGATSQAGETQNANDEVLHMGGAIDKAADNVNVLGNSSNNMKNYSDKASSTLAELIKISELTQKSVDEVQRQTNLTNQSAMDIQTATELIADIASQTNLLSLNASIEAARAGENGRGFAVVANEIRNLADQSAVSADKIAKIVNTLISNSNESVETMGKVMNDIDIQSTKLEATRNMFDSLNSEILDVARAVEGIKAEMQKLNELKVGVLSSVEAMAAIAQENAASTEETAASMQELTDIVERCSESTGELVKLSKELEDSTKVFTL